MLEETTLQSVFFLLIVSLPDYRENGVILDISHVQEVNSSARTSRATTTTTYATKVYRINIVFAMLKTFSSICLLTLILISLVSTTSILLQQHYAPAEGLFQKRYPHVTFVHANTNDILAK